MKNSLKQYFQEEKANLTRECSVYSFDKILNNIKIGNNTNSFDGYNFKNIINLIRNSATIYFGAGIITASVFLFTFNVLTGENKRAEVLAINTEDVTNAIDTIDSIDSFN